MLHMLLEDVKITDSGLHELGTEQLPRIGPFLSIRGEDTMSQEILPIMQKILSFPVVIELSGEDSLRTDQVSEMIDSRCRRVRLVRQRSPYSIRSKEWLALIFSGSAVKMKRSPFVPRSFSLKWSS